MDELSWHSERQTAIHLLRSGLSPTEVAAKLNRSLSWVYKWQSRFGDKQDWQALHAHSRAPKHSAHQLPTDVARTVRQARSELEAQASQPGHLKYIGARAVQGRLRDKHIARLPSTASIERILSAAGMTRPKQVAKPEVNYPALQPTEPHQLCQIDIVPHYLKGGHVIACFNALDVVSRYPSGQQWLSKTSQQAADFLWQTWQEQGIPRYTQVDNEGCFSGGFTHPGVLGKVLRQALYVGTELVFSPHYHPESNGFVERFHQDYLSHVWEDTQLTDLEDVRRTSQQFFQLYRYSHHSSGLQGRSPAEVHHYIGARKLSTDEPPPTGKLSLTEGQVHFIRKVSPLSTVSILNLDWAVLQAKPEQGVWATLRFTLAGATLRVYDAAPDAAKRVCLAEHPFELKEPVQPLRPRFQAQTARQPWLSRIGTAIRHRVPEHAFA
jgi:transposase InsO family protein